MRTSSIVALVGLSLGASACGGARTEDASPHEAPGSESSWIPDCEPHGPSVVKRGRVEIARPDWSARGKKFSGAWLVDGETRFVLTYERESPVASLEGRTIEVVGRACTPRAQALVADHLLVERFTPLP